jgi:hypothetical protein
MTAQGDWLAFSSVSPAWAVSSAILRLNTFLCGGHLIGNGA